MCKNSTDNQKRYESMKHKSGFKAMREKEKVVPTELKNLKSGMFTLVRRLKINGNRS